MGRPLEGIKVVEVAIWGYVPSAGAALSDMGAQVLKVESPEGDPIRQLTTGGVAPGAGGFTFLWEIFNRGKQGFCLDLKVPGAIDVLHALLEDADVFLTNLLPPTRRKFGIDVADLKARHPRLIYATGSGLGPNGLESEKGGYDAISMWARGGVSSSVTPREVRYPLGMPSPAFGDVLSGLTLAGGISAAIAQRERTGEASVVDGALFATALWGMQAAIVGASLSGQDELPKRTHEEAVNPLANTYATSDGRHVVLCMLQRERYWKELCLAIERPDLATDERFLTSSALAANLATCIQELDKTFATRPLEEWKARLAQQPGQWDIVQRVGETPKDAQALANGFVQDVDYGDGRSLKMVSVPVLFNREHLKARPAPGLGEHTDTVLSALGFDEEKILDLRIQGIVV
jgi:crotonobetainyl-CoA:carnitine CoA-transferase CaiB-like acyl-CoA transferase